MAMLDENRSNMTKLVARAWWRRHRESLYVRSRASVSALIFSAVSCFAVACDSGTDGDVVSESCEGPQVTGLVSLDDAVSSLVFYDGDKTIYYDGPKTDCTGNEEASCVEVFKCDYTPPMPSADPPVCHGSCADPTKVAEAPLIRDPNAANFPSFVGSEMTASGDLFAIYIFAERGETFMDGNQSYNSNNDLYLITTDAGVSTATPLSTGGVLTDAITSDMDGTLYVATTLTSGTKCLVQVNVEQNANTMAYSAEVTQLARGCFLLNGSIEARNQSGVVYAVVAGMARWGCDGTQPICDFEKPAIYQIDAGQGTVTNVGSLPAGAKGFIAAAGASSPNVYWTPGTTPNQALMEWFQWNGTSWNTREQILGQGGITFNADVSDLQSSTDGETLFSAGQVIIEYTNFVPN